MKAFEVQESQEGRTAWIYPEADGEYEPVTGEPEPKRVAIKLRHVAPREAEKLESRMIAAGIKRRKTLKGGAVFTDQVPGREHARDRLYAEAFVVDWQGFEKDGAPLPYSPELLANLLATETWLNKAIGKATEEFESFFVRNGNGTSSA